MRRLRLDLGDQERVLPVLRRPIRDLRGLWPQDLPGLRALALEVGLAFPAPWLKNYGMRQGAGTILRAADTGNILLVRRSSQVSEPGVWAIAGGMVDAGETPRQAVVREVAEELGEAPGLAVAHSPFHHFSHPDKPLVYYTFFSIVPMEFEPSLNWEHDGYVWLSPAEALRVQPLHPNVASAVARAFGASRRGRY